MSFPKYLRPIGRDEHAAHAIALGPAQAPPVAVGPFPDLGQDVLVLPERQDDRIAGLGVGEFGAGHWGGSGRGIQWVGGRPPISLRPCKWPSTLTFHSPQDVSSPMYIPYFGS